MTEDPGPATPNNWLSPEGSGQIRMFLSGRNEFLVDKEICYRTILEFIRFRFGEEKPLRILDLGCGDGALGGFLADNREGVSLSLLDGSETMLAEAARRRPGALILKSTFEEWLDTPLGLPGYDAVVSSMAIHHLAFPDKERLFSRVFHELETGGAFLDYDVVRPASRESESFQFEMWRSWMAGRAAEPGGSGEDFRRLPESYKAKSENKPSGLEEQLASLKRAGFQDAECLVKRGIFALFGGTKF